MEIYTLNNDHHDTEVWFGESSWPAFRRDDESLLVDFRLYERGAVRPTLGFFPERLAEFDIPDDIIVAAALGDGFVVFDHNQAERLHLVDC